MLNQFSRPVLLSFVVALLVALCYALLIYSSDEHASTSSSPSSMGQMLQAPFVGIASAAPSSDVMTTLQDEAGIAAYHHITTGIDLDLAYSLFQTVNNFESYQEDGYIMGMINSDAYGETWEPRIFINQEGWIVAYHPKDVTYRMLDLDNCNIILRSVVQQIATALGETSNVNLYHFDYPDPTKLMTVREYGSDYMSVKMPEDSVLHFGFIHTSYSLDLDNERVVNSNSGGTHEFDSTNFAVGIPHIINNNYNYQSTCLMLFYSD